MPQCRQVRVETNASVAHQILTYLITLAYFAISYNQPLAHHLIDLVGMGGYNLGMERGDRCPASTARIWDDLSHWESKEPK